MSSPMMTRKFGRLCSAGAAGRTGAAAGAAGDEAKAGSAARANPNAAAPMRACRRLCWTPCMPILPWPRILLVPYIKIFIIRKEAYCRRRAETGGVILDPLGLDFYDKRSGVGVEDRNRVV